VADKKSSPTKLCLSATNQAYLPLNFALFLIAESSEITEKFYRQIKY